MPAMRFHRFDMDIFSKFSLPVILFALTIAFGFWLSKVGKPYNGALFNVHKLIALGAVVLAVVQFSKTGIAGSPLLIAALIAAGLCAAVLFASGALMSIGKWNYNVTLTVHRIVVILAVFASGVTTCLLAV